jgi:hypothetical protein
MTAALIITAELALIAIGVAYRLRTQRTEAKQHQSDSEGAVEGLGSALDRAARLGVPGTYPDMIATQHDSGDNR